MSGHTPGPWRAVIDRSGEDGKVWYFPHVQINRSHRIIVNVGPTPEGLREEVWTNSMETCEANAYLIAAAPEMLEALRAVVELAGTPHRRVEMIRKVKAAIAKAEGSQ